MRLEGSCHCGAVRFTLDSRTPYPYMACYCSICRKTAGGGGFAINIMGESATLEVEGEASLATYRALVEGRPSDHRRHFCKVCGSHLWASHPRWPKWVWPLASAIDTALPKPPGRVHIMVGSAAPWLEPPEGEADIHFPEYPRESIEEWHRRHELYEEV